MSQTPHRILLAVSSLSPGGAERVITEMANAWAGRFEVAVLTLSHPEAQHYALNSRVERIALDLLWPSNSVWQTLAGNLRRSRMIRRSVRAFKPDVVVSFIEQNNVRVLLALLASGIPVLVSERVDPRRHWVSRGWRLARRLLYPLATAVVVQTETVANWARLFVRPARVRVIPNFVRVLPPVVAGKRDVTSILAVGRLGEQKGFDLLLMAFASSRLSARGFTLTILGEGPQRPALTQLASELGISGAVRMPGLVSEPERWMAEAAIFVLPSRYEGFPNVLLEAMAMGCAVIATDCDSGPREIVRHEVDGVLVPPEDVVALTDAMTRLANDATLRERLGTEAQKVRERFSAPRILGLWESLIAEVCR